MRKPYRKRLIASTLALSILLGSGLVYGANQRVFADDQNTSQQQQTANDNNQNSLKKHKLKSVSRHQGGYLPIIQEAADILGMDKNSLAQALKDKSLADIAKEKGISADDLVTKLYAERSKKIDEAVQAGKITADKAEKLKSGMTDHLKFLVNQKGAPKFFQHKGMNDGPIMKPSFGKLSEILGISQEELTSELKSGKSLAEIAQSKGLSKDQLVSKIIEDITPKIEKMVEHKREAHQ
jgi:uncharacterized protein YidB (DUF937 family)